MILRVRTRKFMISSMKLITLQAKADKQAEEIAQLKKDAQDYESMIIGLEAQKDTKKQ